MLNSRNFMVLNALDMKRTTTTALFALLFSMGSGSMPAHNIRHTENTFLPLPYSTLYTYTNPPETEAVNTPSRIWLDLTHDSQATSQIAIAYLPQATTGIDFGYDAARFAEEGVLSLYSLIDGNAFVIQARPSFTEFDVVELGYVAPLAGSYTLSINRFDGLFTLGQKIYIKDNDAGVITDLTMGALTFTSETGTFDNRFTLGYSTEALSTPKITQPQTLSVYKSGQSLVLESGGVLQAVRVYDTAGRTLYNNNNINNTTLVIDALTTQKQLVLIETTTATGKIIKKIIY